MEKIGENFWKYRLFISHVGADQELALALVEVLKKHTVALPDGTAQIVPVYMEKVVDNWDPCFGDFMDWSGSRVEQSDGILAIVSHNACVQDDDGCTDKVMDKEIRLAQDVKKDIMLLQQRDCKMTSGRKLSLKLLSYVSYDQQPSEQNMQELLRDIDAHVRSRAAGKPLLEYAGRVAVGLKTTPVSDTGEFVGRKQDIEAIHKAFEEDHKRVVCIYGQGGMGKTTLAKMYAAAYPQTPVTICYCDSDTSLMDAIIRLPVVNDDADAKDLTREEKYNKRCDQLRDLAYQYIIILDNFNADFTTQENREALSAMATMPPACNFIISSRNAAPAGKNRTDIGWMEIKPLEKEELVQLFYDNSKSKHTPGNDCAIDKLLEMTACHTMTIMLAAKAVADTFSNLTPQVVVDRLLENDIETHLEDTARHDGFENYASIRAHLRTLFALSKLQLVHQRMMGALSLVPRHGLTVQNLKDCGCFDSNAGRQLLRLGYISTTQDQPARLYTHPLLQELCFDDYVLSHAIEYKELLKTIVHDYVKTSKELTAGQLDMAVDYGELLVKRMMVLQHCGIDDKKLQGDLYFSLGCVYYYQRKEAEAEKMYLQAIALRETLAQETGTVSARRDLANSYNNLGLLYGKPEDAENMHLQAIALREALVQETGTVEARSDLSASYNNLGLLYSDQGKQAEAEKLYLQAIALKEALVQETETTEARSDLAISYNNLGILYDNQRKQDEAEKMYRQAMSLYATLAQETGTVSARRDEARSGLAKSYNDLGILYDNQGKHTEAESMYRQAIALQKALVQETGTVKARSDLAQSYNNLGILYKNQGKQDEAEKMYRQAMSLYAALARETGTVEARSGLAKSYNNLGVLYGNHGKQDEEEKMYLQAIALRKALVKETNTVQARSDLAQSYYNLGILYYNQGKPVEAESMYLQAIALRKALVQETGTVKARSDLAQSYNNLGVLYGNQGKQSDAETMYMKAKDLWEALVKETNTVQARSDLAQSYYNLGILYYNQGKPVETEKMYRQAIALRVALVQETGTVEARSDLARSYNNLGVFCIDQRKYEEAETLYRKAIKLREILVRETGSSEVRSDLAISYHKLGFLCHERGKQTEAEIAHRQAIASQKAIVQETGTLEARSDLFHSYHILELLYHIQGKQAEAESMCRQEIALLEVLVKETDAVEMRSDLTDCYMRMVECCKAQRKRKEAKEWFKKAEEIKGTH